MQILNTTPFYLQMVYYTRMHVWKESIFSTETRLIIQNLGPDQSDLEPRVFYQIVHVSENSWFMGSLATSRITLIILPSSVFKLLKKLQDWARKNRCCAIPVLFVHPLALLCALVAFHIMLVFIAGSVVMDIGRMLTKLCKCNSSCANYQRWVSNQMITRNKIIFKSNDNQEQDY